MEDFLTYTEVDTASHLVVTSSTITGTGVTRNEDALVYDDKGVANFSGDFSHDFDTTATNGTTQVMASWALTNDIDDLAGLISGSKSFLALQHNVGTTYILREDISGTGYNDSVILTNGQQYYDTITRDEGIGTFGTLYCYIYSDSGRTTLVDTLIITLHAKLDLRYVFGFMSFNDGSGTTGDLVVSNLDLGGAVVVAVAQKLAGMFGLGRMGLR